MKIAVQNPMAQLIAVVVHEINQKFDQEANAGQHRAQAHARKLEEAEKVVVGEDPNEHFAAEAALRGMSPQTFAKLVIAKAETATDDPILERELRRQQFLAQAEKAQVPADLDAIRILVAKT